jgi:hypothetical protein
MKLKANKSLVPTRIKAVFILEKLGGRAAQFCR